MTPGLAIIAAVARNGVIGAANTLPWRIPEDLARFRALTTGHAILMGRKTWQSLPRPLPNRQNIVITRQADFLAPGALVVHSLAEALERVGLPLPAYCIGGGELYAVALPHADTLEMTEIDRDFAGNASFPAFLKSDWREVRRDRRVTAAPESMAYAFVTYERIR